MITTSYLDRMLEPLSEALTPEVAQRLVELRADPQLECEIASLRQKANDGSLTTEEGTAYKEIVEALDIVAILQAKAQRFLANHST